MMEHPQKPIFRASDHSFWMGGRRLDSVTQLLSKHGISKDLSDAPEEAVRRAGEHGTMVHDEIDTYIRTGEKGISDEFQDFLDMVYPLADSWVSEVMVWTDDYAGFADLVGTKDDGYIIVDTKTGTFDENATAWQVSMYANAMSDAVKDNVKLYGFDAKMDGKSRLVELNPVPERCIEALLDANRRGERYNPLLPVIGLRQEQIVAVETAIASLERQVKELKAQDDAMKAEILQAMENGRVVKYESDNLRLTYVAPFTRQTLDSNAVKRLYPQVYRECIKTSEVKASLRITVKGDGDEK